MKKVELEIYKINGQFGISLMNLKNGSGSGYRIVGPKVLGSKTIETYNLTLDSINRLIKELNEAKEFLNEGEKKL